MPALPAARAPALAVKAHKRGYRSIPVRPSLAVRAPDGGPGRLLPRIAIFRRMTVVYAYARDYGGLPDAGRWRIVRRPSEMFTHLLLGDTGILTRS